MIVHTAPQGSPEWKAARAGVITASMARVARERTGMLSEQQAKYVAAIRRGATQTEATEEAGYKTAVKPTENMLKAIEGLPYGDFSEGAKNYAFRLAVERISGLPLDEGYETYAMARGHELEPDARAEHELQAGVIVEPAGFITTDDGIFGASADGLIQTKGGAEYKCLISPATLRDVLLQDDIDHYIDQIQMCMWISGREWWHFGMYCPVLKPIGLQFYFRSVVRDDDFIFAMEKDLLTFKSLVDTYEQMLRKRGTLAANDSDVAADDLLKAA